MRYFEDIRVGDAQESAEDYELTEEEIVSFCSKWDPLAFHVDPQAAAATPVGQALHLGDSLGRDCDSTRASDADRANGDGDGARLG